MKKQKQEHKNEIIQSRRGGFGGSDAKIFNSITSKGVGKLSATDLFRISVAKGENETKAIPETPAMAAGHAFEDLVETLLLKNTSFQREVKLSSKLSDKFDTFAHADFYNAEEKHVIECKFTQGDVEKTINTYYAQLQWYYLLGVDKVTLYNGHGDVGNMLLGECDNYDIVDIEPDSAYIESLKTGVVLLTSVWDDLRIDVGEEWNVADLLAFDAESVNLFTDKLRQIERIETEAKDLREQIKGLFELYNIKSLKSDNYLITYVGESIRETLDADKLKKEHKEIDFSLYKKQSKVKSSIKIKLY